MLKNMRAENMRTSRHRQLGRRPTEELPMNRRQVLAALFAISARSSVAATPSVSTIIGTGSRGYSDHEVNNPYGLVIGPDRALYFCDLDNKRIRRLDLETHRTTVIAGNGQKAYSGDGGPATAASLNMPHEIQFDAAGNMYIAERDNHVVRKVEPRPASSRRSREPVLPDFREMADQRRRPSSANLTALPLIRAASCSSATSVTTAFDRSISPPG
jgi:hypothetical protein